MNYDIEYVINNKKQLERKKRKVERIEKILKNKFELTKGQIWFSLFCLITSLSEFFFLRSTMGAIPLGMIFLFIYCFYLSGALNEFNKKDSIYYVTMKGNSNYLINENTVKKVNNIVSLNDVEKDFLMHSDFDNFLLYKIKKSSVDDVEKSKKTLFDYISKLEGNKEEKLLKVLNKKLQNYETKYNLLNEKINLKENKMIKNI